MLKGVIWLNDEITWKTLGAHSGYHLNQLLLILKFYSFTCSCNFSRCSNNSIYMLYLEPLCIDFNHPKPYFEITLGALMRIKGIRLLKPFDEGEEFEHSYRLLYSLNGCQWKIYGILKHLAGTPNATSNSSSNTSNIQNKNAKMPQVHFCVCFNTIIGHDFGLPETDSVKNKKFSHLAAHSYPK